MTTLSSEQPRRLLVGILAFLLLGAGLVACGSDDDSAGSADAAAAGDTAKQEELRTAMRELWNEHGNLTVRGIVAAVSGLDETGPVVEALQANQNKIGDAVKPYYGDESGDALADLLHEHIDTAVATLTAAIGGDPAELETAAAAFYANGDDIAAFLSEANPELWQLDAMEQMMTVHLDQVIELATLQIEGDHQQALTAYNTYIHHLNVGMADMLSDGIIAQFPDQF